MSKNKKTASVFKKNHQVCICTYRNPYEHRAPQKVLTQLYLLLQCSCLREWWIMDKHSISQNNCHSRWEIGLTNIQLLFPVEKEIKTWCLQPLCIQTLTLLSDKWDLRSSGILCSMRVCYQHFGQPIFKGPLLLAHVPGNEREYHVPKSPTASP
jgi:hypothetical protein